MEQRICRVGQKNKILRNGKFGIGVLATFLLGEKAIICTRSYKEKMGWKFSIQLDQDNINIERVDTTIGTKISISLTDMVINKLKKNTSWNCCNWKEWYQGDNPLVTYIVDGKKETFGGYGYKINFFVLMQDQYDKYIWSYDSRLLRGKGAVCCNDIIIKQGDSFPNEPKYRFSIGAPYIKIEDSKGSLPVDLARAKLLSLPCEEMLYIECCKYVLARLLTLNVKDNMNMKRFNWNNYWGEGGRYIIFSKKGALRA